MNLKITLSILAIFVGSLFATVAAGQTVNEKTVEQKVYQFSNGQWFDGKCFVRGTYYSVNGIFTKRRPKMVDETVDLANGFVIPPFGDAHTHNLDGVFNLDKLIKSYLAEGTFYVQVLGNSSLGSAAARPFLNKPSSLDVSYANGMLTSTYGHPFMVYEPLAMGIYNPAEGYRRIADVKKSRLAFKQSYWFLDSKADVDKYWPSIIAAKPDLIKIGLLDAQNKIKNADAEAVDKGLSPEVAEYVTQLAHQAGFRVFAHIETADDFRLGLRIGIDGFAHSPYYGWNGRLESKPKDDLTKQDLKLAAAKGVVVIPTAGRARFSFTEFSADGKETVDQTSKDRIVARQRKLFREMRNAGIRLALGLDTYGATLLPELLYLSENNIFDNADLLKIAVESTPQAIFPGRRIGRLEEGYEASFLVLKGDPLKDFAEIRNISKKFKRGKFIE